MKIVENNMNYLNDFIKLNEEWIQKYFEIEQIDIDLAKKPSLIIDNGGYIFSIIDDEKVVGVCALINGAGMYELARMAVSNQYQGRGYGSLLIETCLKKLKEINAEKVSLVSNTKLEIAIHLYQKHGFNIVSTGEHPIYKRANIVMIRDV